MPFPFTLATARSYPFHFVILACTQANWTYNDDRKSGRLEYWWEDNYDANLNCFFRIEVPDTLGRSTRIKINFEAFDFGPGYDYEISLTSIDPKMIDGGFQYPKKGKLSHNKIQVLLKITISISIHFSLIGVLYRG